MASKKIGFFDNVDENKEDYWNESSVQQFSFDDAEHAVRAVDRLNKAADNADARSIFTDDSDLIEEALTIGSTADSRPRVDYEGSVRYKASGASSSASLTGSKKSEANLLSVNSYPSVNRSLEDALRVSPTAPKRDVSQEEYRKMEQECARLRQKLERAENDRYRSGDIRNTVMRIVKDEPYGFECFKSRDDKIRLLDCAIEVGDGNAITAVLLHLHATLVPRLFSEQLLLKPLAANHYVAYLKQQTGQTAELVDLLMMLGRKEEAALVDFTVAANASAQKQRASAKITALQKCVQSSLAVDPSLASECSAAREYVALLERQLPVDESDERTSKEGRDQAFREFPKTATLVDQPVLTTLYYCALYHYELPQTSFASPLSVKIAHQLTEKQFVWVVLKALARRKRWAQIEGLLTSKSVFGGAKLKSPMPFEKVAEVLAKHAPPVDVLSKYVQLIPDANTRLDVATRLKCHNVVVDGLVLTKDKQALINYKAKLVPHSNEAYYAEGALNKQVNWKN